MNMAGVPPACPYRVRKNERLPQVSKQLPELAPAAR